ncbi:MAG: hypothetical protein RIR12_446 [Bacteroidota bacterium]|jgi:hypothetical protein
MKKIFAIFLLLLIAMATKAQNISTGVASWTVSPGSSTAVIASPHPIWNGQQPTPVVGTNAKWISPTGSINVTSGIYSFETIINVSAGINQLNLNFQVSADDVLMGLELVTPSSGVIILGVPPVNTPNYYSLRKAVDTTIKCPTKGEYKLRVRVRFIDQVGGFLLSGNATQIQGQCCDCPVPNTNVNLSLNTTLGGGTVATAAAIGASTTLGNGWTLKQVSCASTNGCKWMPGSIKWQSTGSTITIPATVLSPGCYVLTHYVNRCSKNWNPKACLSYRSICFTVCDNAIKVSDDINPKLIMKTKEANSKSNESDIEKEAELINNTKE